MPTIPYLAAFRSHHRWKSNTVYLNIIKWLVMVYSVSHFQFLSECLLKRFDCFTNIDITLRASIL